MRASSLALIFCAACHTMEPDAPEGAELSRSQCADLVRRVQKIESEDTAGMRLSMTAALRAGIEGCLAKGTDRAYKCVLVAESVSDLRSCDSLFKE